MRIFLYVVTFIGGIIGTFVLFSTLLMESAPQQGAGAAIAIAFVVIPYCMARVWEKARQEPLAETFGKLLIAQSQIARQSQTNTPSPAPANVRLNPN